MLVAAVAALLLGNAVRRARRASAAGRRARSKPARPAPAPPPHPTPSARQLASPTTLDCPLRQIAVDKAQALQPFRPNAAFQELADALNGAQEAQNCAVKPSATSSATSARRVLSYPLPPTGAHVLYVSPHGSDIAAGTLDAPLRSITAALAAVRAARGLVTDAPRAYLVLRAGIYYFGNAPLELTARDSQITFQAYPGEAADLSGGVPLGAINWAPATPPARAVWEYREGSLADGFDVLPPATMTPAAAQALCVATPACTALAYAGPAAPAGAVLVSFKHKTFYEKGTGAVWVLNRGYLPGAANLWVADLSSFALTNDVDGVRVNGARAIRARYPNAVTAEDMDAMQIVADAWTKQPFPKTPDSTFSPAEPSRADSAQGFFQHFLLGVGGPCASRFTPAASYWCGAGSQGGGPGPYSAPVGMIASNATTSLPHTPYTSDLSRATVHSWRAGRWFSWVFAVDGATFNEATGQTNFSFSLLKGGNQGSRGGDAGQEMLIENVMEELDAPGEFFYDLASQKLYLWYNSTTGGTPPPANSVVVTQQTQIVHTVGTQAAPVTGVSFLGLTIRDSAPNFLGPHGTPSGGDWAVGRAGAFFFEGTEGAVVDGCLFTTLDGNAVFLSGYTRGAQITRNEFFSIGETAVASWGYTDGSPVAGMGFDATAGNQPRGTLVAQNLVHEVGLWTKQNSFVFQSESFNNTYDSNIAYNGPRAGINFDDGMGGGSKVINNVLANFCRESSDHGSSLPAPARCAPLRRP